jgi:hypothetical protein
MNESPCFLQKEVNSDALSNFEIQKKKNLKTKEKVETE